MTSATPKPRAGEHVLVSGMELAMERAATVGDMIRRLEAERDSLRERERELVDLAEGVAFAYKDVLLRSVVEQHLYDCARAVLAKVRP